MPTVNRREFLARVAIGTAVVGAGTSFSRSSAHAASPYPDWIPPSTKPPKRGGSIARASAWDPPVTDPRLTQSIGLFQFGGLVHNRLVRYGFNDEVSGPGDMTLRPDLAESWQS